MKRIIIDLFILVDLILMGINIIAMNKSYRVNQEYQEDLLEVTMNNNLNNSNLVGSINILDQTYPIMQGSDNEFYLNHNIKDEESKLGSLFFDYRCSPLDDLGCIIYGHSSKTYDLPFNILDKYLDNFILNNNQEITIMYKGFTIKYEIEKVIFEYPKILDKNTLYLQTCQKNQEGLLIVVARKI